MSPWYDWPGTVGGRGVRPGRTPPVPAVRTSGNRRRLSKASSLRCLYSALLGIALVLLPVRLCAQARPSRGTDLQAIYQALIGKIDGIPIFDDHAHPGFSDDPNVDAMTSPPGSSPLRLRETNPEFLQAARALFHYPYSDFSPAHEAWLLRQTADRPGIAYWDRILDQCGIETSLANRVDMPDYLDPKRFRWVFFVDSFLFPFDNRSFINRNPDEAVYIPLQEKMLHRYMQQAALGRLPDTFSDYLTFITQILERNKRRGGIAIKFEIAYFRSLNFSDPPRAAAAAIYVRYRHGGLPDPAEYKTFQDYVFRYLIREGGRLHLPVNIHTAAVGGDYFSLQKSNILNLENILRDPRYLHTTFVLLHGGYPYDRQAIWLTAMRNVYLDSSEIELLLYPSEFTRILKDWLEIYPDKVMFGSDAYPYSKIIGAEEGYWLGVRSARQSLAWALAQMIGDHEITEAEALEMAHSYLHDTAARLYSPIREGVGSR